jgi:hypothetical protein
MKFTINNKKGASTFLITFLVIAAIAFVAGFLIMGGGSKALAKLFGLTGDGISGISEDCDKDDINNDFDACPCTPTLGDGDQRSAYIGCPKGTSNEARIKDKEECFGYQTAPLGKVTSSCTEDDEDQCKTKCDWVNQVSIVIETEEDGTPLDLGIEGDYDLTVSKFEVFEYDTTKFDDSSGGQSVKYVEDLENSSSQIGLYITFEVKNIGSQETVTTFNARFYVCDGNKDNCKEIKNFKSGDISSDNGNPGFTFKPLGSQKSFIQKKQVIFVGTEGDYCDGPRKQTCYVKVKIDHKNALKETNEKNNEAGVYVTLENQKVREGNFKTFESIELVVEDPDNANPFTKQIEQTCPGYIGDTGDTSLFACDSITSCDEGEYPDASPKNINWNKRSQGCLIVAGNLDGLDSCSYAGAADGVIINTKKTTEFKEFKTQRVVTKTDEEEALTPFLYPWTSLSEGSLMCKSGDWYLCKDENKDQILVIGEKVFVCESEREWKKR